MGRGLWEQVNPSSYSSTDGVTPFSEFQESVLGLTGVLKLSGELSHLCNVV